MPIETVRHINLKCVADTFCPHQSRAVRWLDVEADYQFARDFWPFPISPEDWRSFRDEGYQYCAVVENTRIISIAAVWSLQHNMGAGHGLAFLREYGVVGANEEDVERLRLSYEQG